MFKHDKIVAMGVATVATLVAGSVFAQGMEDEGGAEPQPGAMEESTEATEAADAAALDVESDEPFGEYLVDADGNTLYIFTGDSEGASTCTGECASAWPPLLTTGDPRAVAPGLDEEQLGTITRDDGTMQVTYNGYPLYLHTGDSATEEITGQHVSSYGGEWYLVAPDGTMNQAGEQTGMVEEGVEVESEEGSEMTPPPDEVAPIEPVPVD